MKVFEIKQGNLPVVLAVPHTGQLIPEEIFRTFTNSAKQLSDSDWNVHRLYDDLLPDATVVRALFHRYVIDPNRDPLGSSLYTDSHTTALCPLTTFDGDPIYLPGLEPEQFEISRRRSEFHAPYHKAIREALQSAQSQHGVAILYDCHSIRSRIPFLFPSQLPDFNIGTVDSSTCALAIENEVRTICEESEKFSTVVNGRFRGGWTTRHYGDPSIGIHAIQMELAQSTYMLEKPPWTYDETKAEILRRVLKRILEALVTMAAQLTTLENYQHGLSS